MGIPKSPKRTGGPKTAAGKQRVALNAVSSGAYATHLLLPDEDPAQFALLEAAFADAFAPTDAIEQALVNDLAALGWKKQRLARVEQTHLSRLVTAPVNVLEDKSFELQWPPYARYAISQLGTLDADQHKLARDQLATLRRLKQAPITDAVLTVCQSQEPHFYTLLMGLAASMLGVPAPDHQDVLTGYVTNIDGTREPCLDKALTQMTWQAEAILWAYPRKDRLQQTIATIRAQRLIDWCEKAPLQRASDDLNRAFFRTLAELRQQQNWRQRRDAIDVTPASDAFPTAAPVDAVVTADTPVDAPTPTSATASPNPTTHEEAAPDDIETDDDFHYD